MPAKLVLAAFSQGTYAQTQLVPADISSSKNLKGFQRYITQPNPKAFALSDNGSFQSYWNARSSEAAKADALSGCAMRAGKACRIVHADNDFATDVKTTQADALLKKLVADES